MRRIGTLAVTLALLTGSVAEAQVPIGGSQLIIPSPLGIILTIGQWLLQDNKRVYFIKVVGEGNSTEEAKMNGFRLAVEQAVGTLILSETEAQNGRIKRDEIISYASGFVDQFTVIGAEHHNGRYRVTMEVWVGESGIARRLLNESVGQGTMDGQRISVQVSTIQQERQTGDRVVETVLLDFPKRAFDVEVEKTKIDFQARTTVQIVVPYTISWNSDYVASLTEAVKRTSQSRITCWWVYDHECIDRASRQFYFGNLAFDDAGKVFTIAEHMSKKNKPVIQLSILDAHSRVLKRACYQFLFSNVEQQPGVIPEHWMLEVMGRSVWVNRSKSMSGKLVLNFAPNSPELATAERIDVRMVAENTCQTSR